MQELWLVGLNLSFYAYFPTPLFVHLNVQFTKQTILNCSSSFLTGLFASSLAFLPYTLITKARKFLFNPKLNYVTPMVQYLPSEIKGNFE